MGKNVERCLMAMPVLSKPMEAAEVNPSQLKKTVAVSPEEGADFMKRLESKSECYPVWMRHWMRHKGRESLQGVREEMNRNYSSVSGKLTFQIILDSEGKVAVNLMDHSDSLAPYVEMLMARIEHRARAALMQWPIPKDPVVFKAIFLL